jgi:hypothetical protein
VAHGGKGAFDRVGRPDVLPVFRWVVVEAQQRVPILDQPGDRLVPFHAIGGEAATLDGCVEDGSWCRVFYDGIEGWSYAPYLSVSADQQTYVLPERPSTVEVTTVTYEDTGGTMQNERAGATAGAVIGSLAAYAAGGPVGGIIAGGILGGAAGSAAVEPTTETVTYIESNPVDTVYLDGEVAVGAGVPQEVTLYEIPSQPEYRYVNINGQTVLVNPENNAIVRVIR